MEFGIAVCDIPTAHGLLGSWLAVSMPMWSHRNECWRCCFVWFRLLFFGTCNCLPPFQEHCQHVCTQHLPKLCSPAPGFVTVRCCMTYRITAGAMATSWHGVMVCRVCEYFLVPSVSRTQWAAAVSQLLCREDQDGQWVTVVRWSTTIAACRAQETPAQDRLGLSGSQNRGLWGKTGELWGWWGIPGLAAYS